MSLQEVKVSREEVLKIVQENKTKHDLVLTEAIAGYWLDAETHSKKHEKDELETINKTHRERLKQLRKARKEAIKQLKVNTKSDLDQIKAKDKSKGFRYWNGKYPEDHGDDYTGTIRRLELCVEPQVELDTNEFDAYIRNKWQWRDSFLGSNSCYVTSYRSSPHFAVSASYATNATWITGSVGKIDF